MTQEAPSRRLVVPGLVVTVAAGAAGYAVASTSSAADPKPSPAAANAPAPAAAGGGTPLANLSEIPADGGLVLDDAGVVLTRDAAGEVKAFSAVCTHQGCNVTGVQQGEIVCPCHGSRFDASTGEPTAGPARRPLPPIAVAVRNDAVFTI